MKSIYNSTTPFSLNELSDVSITSPINGEALIYDGLDWTNQPIPPSAVLSVFNRAGSVSAQDGDYNIDQLGDVAISAVLSSDYLRNNGSNWVNSPIQLSDIPTIPNSKLQDSSISLTSNYGSFSTSPVSLGGTTNLTINDASISNAGAVTTAAQTFAGNKTFNGSIRVNGGILDNTGSSGATYNYISNNGLWTPLPTYNFNFINGSTFTAVLDTVYTAPNCTITLPIVGSGDTGRRITISCSQGAQTMIIIPNGVFLSYYGTNFTMNSPYGTITFIVSTNNQYEIFAVQGTWFSPSVTKPITASNLNVSQLQDTNISSPTDNQALLYNIGSSNWQNKTLYAYNNYVEQVGPVNFQALPNTIHSFIGGNVIFPSSGISKGDKFYFIQRDIAYTTFNFVLGQQVITSHYQNNGPFFIDSSGVTGHLELIVIETSPVIYYVFSMSGKWFKNTIGPFYDNGFIYIENMYNVDIPTAPNDNQVLTYKTSTGKWTNQDIPTDLIFNDQILPGSTLISNYDWVTIMDITYNVLANVNMTIMLNSHDTDEASTMIWDVETYSNNNPGDWIYVQPRTLNNWSYYCYALYMKTDLSDPNKFYIGFQKVVAGNPTSTNTGGYYFKIYNYADPSTYLFNMYTNPVFTPATTIIGYLQTVPRQIINKYQGTDISSATITLDYKMNYNIKITIWTEVDVLASSNGQLDVFLNAIPIFSMPYHNVSTSTQTCSVYLTEIGDVLGGLYSGVLSVGSNNLTFAISGVGDTSISNYSASIALLL